MPLSQSDFITLKKRLAKELVERSRRIAYLQSAFYEEETLAAAVSPDGEPIDYVHRLLHYLDKDQPRTRDGRLCLCVYLEYVAEDRGGDLAAFLQPIIATLKTSPAHSPNADTPTWDRPIAVDEAVVAQKLRGFTRIEPPMSGGMAQVWRSTERLPDGGTREVALKLLHPGSTAEHERRFLRELGIVSGLNHPNIVQVHDFGLSDEGLYVVMPFMSGGTLADKLRKHKQPFTLEQVLPALDQMGEALDYAHQNRVIHRDVKPANILFYPDGRNLVLADFGIAHSAFNRTDATAAGYILGTALYMAPEQWRGETPTPATDLYALGIISYELLTGKPPFSGTALQLSHQHQHEPLPTAPERLTDAVYRVLRRATAKLPGERYQTARDLLNHLRQAITNPDDTENLDKLITSYLDYSQRRTEQTVRELYIDLVGDVQRLLPTAPATPPPSTRPSAVDEDDLPPLPVKPTSSEVVLDAVHTPLEGEYRAREEQHASVVSDICARLMDIPHGVLVGEPGTGKTWTLIRLGIRYADAWKTASPSERAAALIPVVIPLRSFNGQDREGKRLAFSDYVRQCLDVLAPYESRLRARLVLLCDALNEMPRQSPLDDRDLVAEVRDYLADKPRFIVSCRVRDYRDDLGALKPLEQVAVRELDLPQIHRIAKMVLGEERGDALWQKIGGSDGLYRFLNAVTEKGEPERFWKYEDGVPSYTNVEDDNAWRAIFDSPRLIPLCRNPYLLNVVCTIFREDRDLPGSRAALFGRFVDKLLDRERKQAERRGQAWEKDAPETIKTALVALARAMQEAQGTVLPRADALDSILHNNAAWLIDAAISASILIETGGELRFTHQLLQEYFASRIMREALERWEKDGANTAIGFVQDYGNEGWWDAGVWRETTVILGEFLGERAIGPNRVARWLAPVSPEVALNVILRNGEGLTLAEVEPDTRAALIAGAQAHLDEADPHGRACAYRILGVFEADPRPDLLDLNFSDAYWCKVPAGNYVYQRKPAQIDYDYQIGKYPITYAQFQRFLDAPDGYANAKWWDGLHAEGKAQQQQGADEQYFKYGNHPCENVSWYDAMAFCAWLTARLKLPSEMVIRLPTEHEWEKAASWDAQAKRAHVYPYGDDFDPAKGNTMDTGIGQTSAVGIFPEGVSPCGALDMSGNVWEWCFNEYDALESRNKDSNSRRTLRGGSFFDYAVNARAAFRLWYYPRNRSGGGGFRVVCSVPVL